MTNESNISPEGRTTGVIASLEGRQGVWLCPLQKNSTDRVWIALHEIERATTRTPRVGDWIEFDLVNEPGAMVGVRARIFEPTPLERQARLCGSYAETHSMAGGVNPRSHRLDGLTSTEARALRNARSMSQRDYLMGMSENGLNWYLQRSGISPVPGDREATVRRLLEELDLRRA